MIWMVCLDSDSFIVMTDLFNMTNKSTPAMNSAFLPVVADEIWRQYPDYRALQCPRAGSSRIRPGRLRRQPTGAARLDGKPHRSVADNLPCVWGESEEDGVFGRSAMEKAAKERNPAVD